MRVEWSASAEADVLAIADFISRDNPDAALRIYEHIRAQVAGLADFPHKGRSGRLPGTRELAIVGTPYVVIYRVDADEVVIMQVLHGAQAWPPD